MNETEKKDEMKTKEERILKRRDASHLQREEKEGRFTARFLMSFPGKVCLIPLLRFKTQNKDATVCRAHRVQRCYSCMKVT